MTAQPYNRFVFVSWSWRLPCNGNQALACLEISFNSLTQMVSCAEIMCWSFLERINHFSFDLCVPNLQVCFSAFRLGPFGTNLYLLI